MKKKINKAAEHIRKHTDFQPDSGIILGTGLGGLINDVSLRCTLPYQEIPGFPVSTVESHSGKLIFGTLGDTKVVIMQGRFHYYEGYSMQQITFPLRVMKLLGIKRLFISNAAGGLDPKHRVSDLMIINDHINLLPENPLRGNNNDALGPRFPDMSEPYDLRLINQALAIARKYDLRVHQGIYAAVQGPNLETKAEYRFLRTIGADAVGMSTVPENIVARQMGLPVFAVSVITDICTPGNIEKVSVEKIIAAAQKASPALRKLIGGLVANC